MTVQLKRVYEPPSAGDGYRVLVDRLWPRGLSKDAAHVDLWLQRIAPTSGLRTWYGHDPAKWDEFRQRYRDELAGHRELLELLGDIERHNKTLTLLFAAKDELRNEAAVIREALGTKVSGARATPRR